MEGPYDLPMPNGMVWNMIYDENAPPGALPAITPEELWRRCEAFLDEVSPVAEEAGVRLAAHPDDPPMPTVRGQLSAEVLYQQSIGADTDRPQQTLVHRTQAGVVRRKRQAGSWDAGEYVPPER